MKKIRYKRKQKRGLPFEEAVADIIKAIDPSATVQQGVWIDGPDGRRDRDVVISGIVNEVNYNALIECKDYDRTKTGSVGIGIVDALDSKRRDLKVDIAIICSNAGFTTPAVRKASRVGIVLIGVFRQSDSRIRHQLIEQVYFRRIKIEYVGFRLEYLENDGKKECLDGLVQFQGIPVANWVCHRTLTIIGVTPISSGHYVGTFKFKHPIHFSLSSKGHFIANQLFMEFNLSGGWFEQSATIEGTLGIYNFLRRRVRVGAGQWQLSLNGLDLDKGNPIDYPPRPEIEFATDKDTNLGEVWLQLTRIENAKCGESIPLLDDLIVENDLNFEVEGLPLELQRKSSSSLCSDGKTQVFLSKTDSET